MFSAWTLGEWVRNARQCTLNLVADLTDEQLLGHRLDIVNPLLWEIGHLAWFQEKWFLRQVCGHRPIRPDADALYDSIAVAHDTRWDLALPSRDDTITYLREVCDRVVKQLEKGELGKDQEYFVLLSVFHEDMHTEAFTYTRQTLAYPAPRLLFDNESTTHAMPKGKPQAIRPAREKAETPGAASLPGDVEIAGGRFLLGATYDEAFVFDNEKWAHPVVVRPFAIARAPVTQAEFAAFVDDGGYRKKRLWSDNGWHWCESAGAEHPVYWRRAPHGGWQRRRFDQWIPLEPHHPVMHVNWHEAQAYCRWAGRRLPTEVEWEVAASAVRSPDGAAFATGKRRFPWGNDPCTAHRANLDWSQEDCLDVAALPEGDSNSCCRQMLGNVWEWTSSDFLPYPGFTPDPYKEYSQPWFETHKVLRGGCWATRSRLIRNTWRNFYRPDRRDVWAGFRTCALSS